MVAYNEVLTFGSHGTARHLNCSGIDFSEDGDQSWTSAPMAELEFELPFARQSITLELEATPFGVPDIVPAQQVFIYIAGLFVGYSTFTGHAVKTFPLNRNTMPSRTSRLSLVIPTAISPNALRMGDDMRQLGIRLTSIAFRSMA